MTDSIEWYQASPRSPCSIDAATRERIDSEIAGSDELLAALRRLGEPPLAGRWRTAVELLEAARASWSVASCLCHPSSDVQLAALHAIRRMRDPRVLDLLVRYAASLGGPIAGSEEATIRGVLRAEAEAALSALIGQSVHVSWDDATTARAELERLRAAGALEDRGGSP